MFLGEGSEHMTRQFAPFKAPTETQFTFLLTAAKSFFPPTWNTPVASVNWIQTTLSTLPLSVSFPPSSAYESDGSVNCMQVGDWLQRWCGKNSPSSPESLLHMNFYAWYFVLNVHCVPPRGTLKTIWQQFAAYNANIHIKASVHKYAHVLTHAKTHTRILITHFLLFPLSLLIRSCILLCLIIFSEYKTAATYLKRKGGGVSLNIHLSIHHCSSTIRGTAASSASTYRHWIFNTSFVKDSASLLVWSALTVWCAAREGRGSWRPLLCTLRNSPMRRKKRSIKYLFY